MINIQNLDFHYKRSNQFYSNLSLKINPGHIYGVLGKNGSGKSTLFKLLTGLIFAKKGEIDILGYNPIQRSSDLLKHVFYVPEEFELPEGKISDYHDYYAVFYPNFDSGKFFTLIKEAGLKPEFKTKELSYGQKKKVLIAFGIATNVKLLLLDEPTNGLDIPSKSSFRKMVAEALFDERTILISTHQVRDLEHLIDQVIIIEEGKVLFNQGLEEINEKLSVAKESDFPVQEDDEVLYSQQVSDGYHVVRTGASPHSEFLDLELLFNTVVTNPKKIKEIF